MNKKYAGIIFIIALIGIIVTIIVTVFFAKKDVDEYNQMQETITQNEENVEDMGEAIQGMEQQIVDDYDDLDSQIGEY